MRMIRTVYDEILETLGSRKPECGGILGADEDGLIKAYYFDATGKSELHSYVPDVEAVNRVLEEWHGCSIHMVGIVHSHQSGLRVPSCGDISYGIQILSAINTTDCFYLPIVVCEENVPLMLGYVIGREEHRTICKEIGIHIVEGEHK